LDLAFLVRGYTSIPYKKNRFLKKTSHVVRVVRGGGGAHRFEQYE